LRRYLVVARPDGERQHGLVFAVLDVEVGGAQAGDGVGVEDLCCVKEGEMRHLTKGMSRKSEKKKKKVWRAVCKKVLSDAFNTKTTKSNRFS